MHKMTKPFICPDCNQSFTGKDTRGFQSARFPLILNCGHSVCMNCVKLAAKQHKCITCEKCKKTTNLPEGEISVANLVPDLHVVGTLTNLNRSIPRNFKVKFIPAGAPMIREPFVNSTGIRCENCSTGNAKWNCDKCSANLCNKCFDKIHSVSKLFKKHNGTRLVAHAYRSTVQAGCQEHEKPIEFYCEDDGQLACSHCAVTGAHKGHQLVTLMEKNQNTVEDLRKVSEEATKMKRRLTYTEKKLSDLLPNAKPNTQSCEQEIRDFFHELHCCLQLRETELLNELSDTVTESVVPLENMHQQVSENVKELTSLLNDADLVIINSSVAINAVELVSKLQQSLDFPCHLLTSGESTKTELEVQLDSNVKETFRNIGKLDTNLKQRFQLVSERELPPNHQVDILDNESSTTEADSLSLNGSLMEDAQDQVFPNIPNLELQPPKVAVKAKNARVLQQELVRVKHIKNPCEFWVQRMPDISKLNQLTLSINRWVRLNTECLTPSQLALGELYLVQYGKDQNWYRARLKAIIGDATDSFSSVTSNPSETSAATSIHLPSELHESTVASSSNVVPSELDENTVASSSNVVPSEPDGNLLASSLNVVPVEPDGNPVASSSIVEPKETSIASSSSVVNSELSVVSKEVVTENAKLPQTNGDSSNAPSILDNSSESLKSWAEAVEDEESKETSLNQSFSNFMVIVQYVDYGNTETVSITRMQMMQSQFLKLPCLALQCSLWKIVPKDENWSEASVRMFAKFAGNSDCLMRVVDERNNILHIDLARPPIADIANDVPVSVREALIFMEMAYFFCPQSSTLPGNILATHARYKRKQEFFPAEQLPAGQKVNVVVNHVNSPSDFYIQQQGVTTSYWNDMTFEIKDYYSNELFSQTLGIFLPTIGMACMANFSLDNQWYRARVIGLPGGSMVNVFYVDFGNTEVLSCCKLAKIIDKFLKLPVQAVQCSLADVTPVGRLGWTEEGVAWFKEATKRNSISMMVHDAPPKEKAVVSLFESTEFAIRCISGLLVVEGHAYSTGSRSAYTEEKQIVPVSRKSENGLLYQAEEMPKQPGVKVKKKHNYTAVTCSHLEDPSCIYIQPYGKEEKENLNRFMTNLQEACDKMKPSQQKWSNGDLCAVLHSKDRKSYRARITSIDEKGATVYLMDYGSSDLVPLDHLKTLEEEFQEDDIFAIKCHLIGMIPAGDTKRWSRSACEFLKETLTSQETIYLKLKGTGDGENDSQAVDLFIKDVKKGGAVEPSTITYKSVTDMLVDEGLAIPTQRSSKASKVVHVPQEEVLVDACNDLDNGVSSGSASNTLIADIQLTEPRIGLSWLPPEKIEDTEIVILPTYVGYDGFIYFHLCGEADNLLKSMRDTLENVFNAISYVPTNEVIRVGQICMAKYDWDEKWYRAEVIKVLKDRLEVIFVDYGNTLVVKLDEIRTHVAFYDFPKLCYRAQLYNVKPVSANGQWPESTLTVINNLVVEKICNVRIEKWSEIENEMYISVNLPGDNPLLPILEEANLVYVEELLSTFITVEQLSREERSKKTPYAKMRSPQLDSIIPVVITQLYQTNLICMQILPVEKPTTSAENDIKEEHDQFLRIMEDLAEDAAAFPMLGNLKPGMVCCGQYTYDDSWYRCLVLGLPGADAVSVLYVDYGNSEVLPMERLRQIPNYYLEFPMQGLICQLHGLKPSDSEDDWSAESYSRMLDHLFKDSSTKSFHAQIMCAGPPLEVTLLKAEPENKENLKVVYEDLIDDGTVSV